MIYTVLMVIGFTLVCFWGIGGAIILPRAGVQQRDRDEKLRRITANLSKISERSIFGVPSIELSKSMYVNGQIDIEKFEHQVAVAIGLEKPDPGSPGSPEWLSAHPSSVAASAYAIEAVMGVLNHPSPIKPPPKPADARVSAFPGDAHWQPVAEIPTSERPPIGGAPLR